MRSVSDKRVLKPFAVRAEARSFSLHPPASEGLRAGASGGLKGGWYDDEPTDSQRTAAQ